MSLTSLAMFVYTVMLRPPPLRWATNKILLLIIPKKVHIPEGTLHLHAHDPVISGALALGVYENYQLELFRSCVREGMVVFDIGANIGLYTVIAARRVGPQGKVFSFEPEEQNFELLQKNIKHNGFVNVHAVPLAVSDKKGEALFYLSEGNKGNHSLFMPDDHAGETSVSTVALDEWARKHHIEKVDVIKMDIQGAEPLALKGMQRLLKNRPVLFTEYEPEILRGAGYDPLELLSHLTGLGYTLYNINEGARSKEKIDDIRAFSASLKKGAYANLLCM